MTVLAQFAALTAKDLRLELRRKESFITVAFFAILILVVFTFSLGPTQSSPSLTTSSRSSLPRRQAIRPGSGEARAG